MANFKETVYENEHMRKYVKDIEKSKNISSNDSYRKLYWVCPICKEETLSTPHSIKKRKYRCYSCNPRYKESVYDNKYMRKYVKNIEESKKISSSSKKYIEWECPKCLREIYTAPQNVKNSGFICPECKPRFEESVYENEYMRKYVKNIEESKIISSKSRIKIDWECPKCKKLKKSTPFSISLNGFICYFCSPNISYPERLMTEILEENKLNYDTQVTFEGCKNKNHLPFDFAIYDKENNLKYLIEMQGEHHYLKESHNRWNTSLVKVTDKIKEKYCDDNNIKLVTIECKKSEFNYILNRIENTELYFLLNNIDKGNLKNDSLVRDTDVDIEGMVNLYLLGVNYNSIAKYFNSSSCIIINLLKKLGYYERHRKINRYLNVVFVSKRQIFKSVHEARRYMKFKNINEIKRNCEYSKEYENNTIQGWMYITDYINKFGFEGLTCPLDI